MRRILPWLAVLGIAVGVAAEDEGPEVDGKAILAHVRWLADDEREGRAAGSEGAHAAGEYIAAHFGRLGLQPPGDDGTFFQAFPIPRGFDVLPETRLEARRGDKSLVLEYGEDLTPISLSGAGEVEAEAVFCGYGIAAPDLGYDDYEGVDVRGKVVLALRHAPQWDDRRSPFADPRAQRRYATFQAKVDTARAAGAAALVLVNDPAQCWKPKDDLLLADAGGNPGAIPVLHVTYRAARRLGKICGLSFQSEQRRIDARLEPRSAVLEGVVLRVHAALEARRLLVRNVCGLLAAPRDEGYGSGETVVIGGHFDHLGLGEFGSLAGSKGEGEVHNGADDNASGTAVVLEIATYLAARRGRLRRDVLFVLFTAEEMGLLGSKHYVEQPLVPLADTVAMVNFDMVGRLERGRLQVGGVGTSPVFPDLLEEKNRRHHIKLRLNPGGRAPSDNASFYEKGIPVLFFFTGLHGDYHRPDDDYKEIDRRGIEKVAALAAEVCLDLATRPTRPPFTRSDASGISAGPHLGLSCEQRDDGVYVIYVEPDSPAEKARFQLEDKVEEFDGRPIRTMSDLQDAHRAAKPRSRVTITVRRGARLLDLKPLLGRD